MGGGTGSALVTRRLGSEQVCSLRGRSRCGLDVECDRCRLSTGTDRLFLEAAGYRPKQRPTAIHEYGYDHLLALSTPTTSPASNSSHPNPNSPQCPTLRLCVHGCAPYGACEPPAPALGVRGVCGAPKKRIRAGCGDARRHVGRATSAPHHRQCAPCVALCVCADVRRRCAAQRLLTA